jgi:acetyl esterase
LVVVVASLALAQLSPARAMSCPALNAGRGINYGSGQQLDAFAPAGNPRPAAIIIHGISGNRRTHINQVLKVVEEAGWAWFSIDYSSAADIREAVKFIQCPHRFNIVGAPVVIGEDKGAALALDLAATGGVRSVVAFGTDSAGSPKDPGVPVLMVHGGTDEEYPIEPARAACQVWLHCTFVTVEKGIHNLENWHPDQWAWKEDLTAWLRADQRGLWPNIVYSRPGGQPLLMDAFLPEGAGPFPAVIVAHGGGWEAGDKQTYIAPLLDVLTRSSFAWFSIDYRLTPYVRNAEQLEDLRAAIRYVQLHHQRFHVDSRHISLAGESAGGQLVAQVASLPCPGCSVAAVVSLYGVYDFTQFTKQADEKQMLDRIFGNWTPPTLEDASPINHISKDLPPLFIIQGTKDELYPGAVAYHAALNRVGVEHQFIVLDGAPHGMENWVGNPEWLRSLETAAAWLRQH